jgi:hypothetical protein
MHSGVAAKAPIRSTYKKQEVKTPSPGTPKIA